MAITSAAPDGDSIFHIFDDLQRHLDDLLLGGDLGPWDHDGGAPGTPLALLVARAALSPQEANTLWLLIGCELDAELRAKVLVHNPVETAEPSAAALRRIIYGPPSAQAWRELSIAGSLRRLGLIVRTDGNDGPATAEQRQTFKAHPRVVALALGDNRIDGALLPFCKLPTHAAGTPAAGLLYAGDAPAQLRDTIMGLPRRAPACVVICGAPGTGRRLLVQQTFAALNYAALPIDCKELAAQKVSATEFTTMIAREALATNAMPVLCDIDELAQSPEIIVTQLNQLGCHWVFATCRQLPAVRRLPCHHIEVGPLDATQHAILWQRALGGSARISLTDAQAAADRYPMAPALIDRIGQNLGITAGKAYQPGCVTKAVDIVVGQHFGKLAERIHVTQSWTDLILRDEQYQQVNELIARVAKRRVVFDEMGFAAKLGRGLGTIALLSGPPGTGKTMTAGLIAKQLALPLFRVDVSQISSKWIGETEKNLGALFDAAEASNAILLFDEADALFTKRTEVKSSNDHHANATIGYLLARIESFTGVCLLTTNLDTSIDAAFRRRLSVHIKFEAPDLDERAQIWRAALPSKAVIAVTDLELHALARAYEMSGGYIRNAVLRAGFVAATQDNVITAALLADAARVEYQAMGRVC